MAGYVDGAGYLMTGGYFVSFMSGNSTRLAVGLVQQAAEVFLAASLVAAFVVGVVTGASVRRVFPRRPETAILATLSAMLVLSACLASGGVAIPAALLLAAAMGVENMVFAKSGEVRIGLTYMTGALVTVGKGLAGALFGEKQSRWAPSLLLWLSLVSGAALGATAYRSVGVAAIWAAAVAVALLTSLSVTIFADPARES